MDVNLRMLTNHPNNKIRPKSSLRVRFNPKDQTGQIGAQSAQGMFLGVLCKILWT